jgi:hypothetical protein
VTEKREKSKQKQTERRKTRDATKPPLDNQQAPHNDNAPDKTRAQNTTLIGLKASRTKKTLRKERGPSHNSAFPETRKSRRHDA